MCFSRSLCSLRLSADGVFFASIAPPFSQKERKASTYRLTLVVCSQRRFKVSADTFSPKRISVDVLKMIFVLINLILSFVTPNVESNDDVVSESLDFDTNEPMIQEELANPSSFDELLRYCDSDDDVMDDESVVRDDDYATFRNILDNPERTCAFNDDSVTNGNVHSSTSRSNESILNAAALQNNSSTATMTHLIDEPGMPYQPVHICSQVNDEDMDTDEPDNNPSTSANNVSNFCDLCHADASALWCPRVNQNSATTPKVETRGRPEEENVTEGDILKVLDSVSKPFLLNVLQCGVQHRTIIRQTLAAEAYTDVDENGTQLGHPIVRDDEQHVNSRERNAQKCAGICYRLLTVVLKQLKTVCPKTYNTSLSEIEDACEMLHADIVGGKRKWKLYDNISTMIIT